MSSKTTNSQLIELAAARVEALAETIRQLEKRQAEIDAAICEQYGPKLRDMYRVLQANSIPPEMHRDLVVEYFRGLLCKK